jgi:hypothetical protein
MRVNYTADETGRLQSVTTYPVDPSHPVLELPDDFDLSGIRDYIVEGAQLVFSQLPAPQPSVQQQIAQLKQNLSDTDYIAAKAVDALIESDSISGILSALSQIRSEYQETLARRQSWRQELAALGDVSMQQGG